MAVAVRQQREVAGVLDGARELALVARLGAGVAAPGDAAGPAALAGAASAAGADRASSCCFSFMSGEGVVTGSMRLMTSERSTASLKRKADSSSRRVSRAHSMFMST